MKEQLFFSENKPLAGMQLVKLIAFMKTSFLSSYFISNDKKSGLQLSQRFAFC